MADISGVFGGSGSVDTFLGLPSAATAALAPGAADVAILGAPCATPYAGTGLYAAGAPAAIRAAAAVYAGAVAHHDFDLDGPPVANGAAACDLGDLPFDEADAAANRARIADAVRQVRAAGARPLVLGGDDSIPYPVLLGYEGAAPLTIVQIDAHIDWREEVGGERLGLSSVMRRCSEMDHVEGIVQIGARAVGSARSGDFEDARAWGAQFVTARTLHAEGVAAALERVPAGARVVIDFDLDALDPSVAPGVIGPAPGGLSMTQAIGLLHGVAAKAEIIGFCLVEFAPERDVAGLSGLAAYRLAANALGLMSRQAVASRA